MSDPLALIGTTVGAYQIQRKRRSFDPYALYFEAIHQDTRETFWLMAYLPDIMEDESLSASVREEWQQIQQVEHTFWMSPIEQIYDPDSPHLFVVYPPFTRSRQLSDWDGKLRPAEIRRLFYLLADVLATAHLHGIYGWLDPRHLYVRKGGEMDLRWYRTPGHYINHVPDTIEPTDLNEWLSYQSPEQIRGEEPTPASDYFALGTLLFETLSGQRAFFHRSPDAVKEQILSGTSHNLQKARLTLEQQELIESLWHLDPNQRLTDMTTFQTLLREIFPEPSPFTGDNIPTDEHPALQLKESQPELPQTSESKHISLSGSFNALPRTQTPSKSMEAPATPTQQPEQADAAQKEKVSEPEPTVAEQQTTVTEEVAAADTAIDSATTPAVDYDPQTPHSRSVILCHKQLNVRAIHPLTIHLFASDEVEVADASEPEPWQRKASSPYIRIVPVFPGCMVSPQEAVVDVRAPRVEARFWVVPQAPINITDAATIQLWHGGLPKDEIPIPCHIRSQLLTKIAGAASAISFIAGAAFEPTSSVAKGANLASQLFHQAVTLFASYGFWFGFFFLSAAVFSYYWLRPQVSDPITYYLSNELPHPSSFD